MNKKGFAISVVLYSMVILVIGIFYLLLGIVRNRYTIGDTFKDVIVNGLGSGFVKKSGLLGDIIEYDYPLTEEDVDDTRFINGNVNDNYIWYSGKLWRIFSIDKDGNIKIITDENVTSIAWHTTTPLDYKNSQIRSWLNNEFLGTLENRDDLLIDTVWDCTPYSSFPDEKLPITDTVTGKVGLLTIYEYMQSGGTDDEKTSNTSLNSSYYWWTMSSNAESSKVWHVASGNYALEITIENSYGVRPCVVLKSGVKITGGKGTKTNPYTIEGDREPGVNNESLNNRISGEYIKFNDVLYRIVEIEEINGKKLTKITMTDYSINKNALASSVAFGSDATQITFNKTYGVGKYLDDWYNADSTSTTYASNYIKDNYKLMIATDSSDKVVWYVGPTNGTKLDYTLSKSGTPVSATIGMSRYGEMFASQFYEGWSTSASYTWLITKYSKDYVWRLNGNAGVYGHPPVRTNSLRPSFYLKDDVKIVSGKGQASNPYQVASSTSILGYITYNVNGQSIDVPEKQIILSDRSTIVNAELSNTKDFKFLGWATSANGDVVYQKGDEISATGDVTLYAKWKTLNNYLAKLNTNDDAFWPTSIETVKANITKVKFVNMEQNEIDTKYNSASIKEDVTDTSKAGSVKTWLESDSTDSTKYIMYIASEGTTYFPSQSRYMFGSFSNLKEITFENINTSLSLNLFYMFYNCSNLKNIDLSNWDISNVTLMYCMFKGCSNLESVNLSNLNAPKVQQIQEIFSGCSKLTTVDLSCITSNSIVEGHSMFYNCTSLTNVNMSNFQVSTTSNVNLYRMFNGCSKLTSIDIRKINFAKVNGFYNMFVGVPDDSEIIVMNETQRNWILGKFSNLNNIKLAG